MNLLLRVFTLPSGIGSPLDIPANPHYRDAALFRTFNLLIYDFNWFYHEVQNFVGFGLIEGIAMVSPIKYFLRTQTWNTG